LAARSSLPGNRGEATSASPGHVAVARRYRRGTAGAGHLSILTTVNGPAYNLRCSGKSRGNILDMKLLNSLAFFLVLVSALPAQDENQSTSDYTVVADLKYCTGQANLC
jgi:hypothetical protein